MSRRKNGRLRRLRADERARHAETRHGGVIVARTIDDAMRKASPDGASQRARYYRYGRDLLVTWQAGRFTLRVTDPQHLKGYAPCPHGLAQRVRHAIEKGTTNG